MALEHDLEQQEYAPKKSERTILSTVTLSHVSQHFYVGLSVLYPEIMKDLSMNYTQLGVVTGTSSMVSGFLQMAWSLLARYMPRRVLLGLGNILMSTGCFLTASANNFLGLLGGNVTTAGGSGAQHPIGTSILAEKFRKEKITGALSLHYGLGYVGNIISPILLSLIAVSFGWRLAVYILAIIPLFTGLVVFYFLRGDQSTSRATSKKDGANLLEDLRSAIHVRSALIIIAAEAFAIGGSGMGVITTYTPVFLKNFLLVGSFETSIIYSISVVGGVAGTIFFGHLARKHGNLKIAAAITGSSSVLILFLGSYSLFNLLIIPHLFIIGATSFAGSSLLQSQIVSTCTPNQREILMGLYFTIGFGCSSVWTTLTGFLIDTYGSFNVAWLLRALLGTIAFSLMLLALHNTRTHAD